MSANDTLTHLGDFSDGFRVNVKAILCETIGQPLKREHLGALERIRGDLQKNIHEHPGSPYLLQHLELYNDNVKHVLIKAREHIHGAVGDFIDEIQRALELPSNPVEKPQEPALLTPKSTSKDFVGSLPHPEAFQSSQPKAPVAEMGPADNRARTPSRLATPPLTDRPRDNASIRDSIASVTEAGSPVASSSSALPRKRSAQGDSSKSPNKKCKKTKLTAAPTKSPIVTSCLKADECVFKFKHHDGFYVLRCNQTICKEKAKQGDVIYFTAHPFKFNRAINHFGGHGHGIKDLDEIFKKYARKVTDATEERNLDCSKSRQFQAPINDVQAESSSSSSSSPPSAPNDSHERSPLDKGKKPEVPINLTFSHPKTTSSLSAKEQGQGQAGSTKSTKESTGQPTKTSGLRTEFGDDHGSVYHISDVETDDELPPLGPMFYNTRRLNRKNYTIPIPRNDEFV